MNFVGVIFYCCSAITAQSATNIYLALGVPRFANADKISNSSSASVQTQSKHTETKNESQFSDLKLKKFSELKGYFVQKKWIQDLELEIQTEGQFQIFRNGTEPTTFHWDVEKPKPSKACIDKVGLHLESGVGDKKQKKSIQFSEIGKESGEQIENLLHLMTLDESKVSEEFEIRKENKQYLFIPKINSKSLFEKAYLDINSEGLVQKVTIYEKSKDQLKISFSKMTSISVPKNSQSRICP